MRNCINVLMAGSNTKVKGGMTTVVESFLRQKFEEPIEISYIATHSEKGLVYNTWFFARSLVCILGKFIFKRPEIVHLHMSERGSFLRKYIIFKIARAFKKKVIIHTHGAEFKEYYLSSPNKIKKQIRNLLKQADKVIALGEKWEEILLGIEPQADVMILKNSVPIPVYEKWNRKSNSFTFLFLAVLNERKGILDLIHASVPVIHKAIDKKEKLSFEIAGDGELMEKARELVSAFGLNSYYHFHGWVDEKKKEELFRKSDVFVLPSYNEGLPMSILEALSYGLPVISTNVGSIDEAVKDGVNGFLLPPGDIETLSNCLEKMSHHAAFEEMNKASRKLAEDSFDEKKYFEEIEKMYLNISQELRLKSEWL